MQLARSEPDLRPARDRDVLDLVHKLSTLRDTQEIMDVVRHGVRELIGADGVTFVLRDGGSCYYAEEDAISPLWKGKSFPLTACISGWAMLNRRTAVIQNIYDDMRIPHDVYRLTFVRSLVMVPVQSEDPVAAIGAYWARERRHDPDEVALLETIANATAVALTNVGLIHSLHNMVEELQARNKQLDLAYRARSCFLSSMSHELRTPLNAILGLSDIMAQQVHGPLGGDRYVSYASEIRNAGRNLLRLVEDVLDLAALGSGSQPLDMETMHLHDIVSSCVHVVDKMVQKANLKLDNRVPHALPPVNGHPRLLTQIVSNILANSVKFTPAGGAIAIDAQRIGKDLALSIADNGIGMSEAEIARATQPFQQADERLERRYQGAGLGLALCKGYIDLHGGRMTIDSAPGKGTTVTVFFPAAS